MSGRRLLAGAVLLAFAVTASPLAAEDPPSATAPDPASAAGAADPEASARLQTETMTRDLGLSVIPIPEVRKINEAAALRLAQALEIDPAEKEDRDRLIRSMVWAFVTRDQALQTVLTRDQQQAYERGNDERSLDLLMNVLARTLRMSDAQKEEVARVNHNAYGRMMDADRPFHDPAASRADRDRAMQELAAIDRDRDRELQQILSKDQWKGYKTQRQQVIRTVEAAWRAPAQ
jgi:hypothetical protein